MTALVAAAVTVAFVLSAIGAGALASHRRPAVVRPPPAGTARDPLPVRAILLAQLLFVSTRSGCVDLDCVAGSTRAPAGDGGAAPGMPFTVHVCLPYSAAWAADATESVLRRWAADGTPIEMAVFENGHGRGVRLCSARTRLQLAFAP